MLARWFGRGGNDLGMLYASIVAEARRPHWYADSRVPDTIDGRFDMVTLVLSLVLLRLEDAHREADSALLTECFVEDMDGQIREIGFGDLVVGKQIGGIMSLLGGRLGTYRQGIDAATLTKTLWRGDAPGAAIVATTLDKVDALKAAIAAVSVDALVAGQLT